MARQLNPQATSTSNNANPLHVIILSNSNTIIGNLNQGTVAKLSPKKGTVEK
jgi:hypothetical protein